VPALANVRHPGSTPAATVPVARTWPRAGVFGPRAGWGPEAVVSGHRPTEAEPPGEANCPQPPRAAAVTATVRTLSRDFITPV